MNVRGQAAIVTGAATGMGAATATALAAAGARVSLLDIKQEILMRQAEKVGGLGVVCDISSAESAAAALHVATAAHGPARVLVNCAGVPQLGLTAGPGGPMPLAEFERTIAINLTGTFNMIRLVAADMMRLDSVDDESRGVVINVASGAATEGAAGAVPYTASKGGVVAMTMALAREFGDAAIRVLTILPGPVDTPMLATLSEEARIGIAQWLPFPKRLADPSEFAALALHICENEFLNGASIRLDAGLRYPNVPPPDAESS